LKYVRVDESKITIIPVAISPAFKPASRPFNKVRPVLLQVGITPNKNLGRLLEAIKDLNCELVIIGELTNEEKNKIEASKIFYKNYWNLSEPALIEKYNSCDILTFVSTYEGFGMPILEAQAVGRAVVTSNVLSMPEVAGLGACLVDPYDVSDIKSAILKIIRNDDYRENLILRGFENVKKFNQEQIAHMFTDLYKEVALGHY
jgi:glycosyltransferase involved in cell wall biosynthesis